VPKREYILASNPQIWHGSDNVTPRRMREIKERIDGGAWQPFATVGDVDAMDVRELLGRVYQDGREDHAKDYELGPVSCRFTMDEIEALVITAADIWAGERNDLSRRQLALAERAHRIADNR
jgi:hypothetical protein